MGGQSAGNTASYRPSPTPGRHRSAARRGLRRIGRRGVLIGLFDLGIAAVAVVALLLATQDTTNGHPHHGATVTPPTTSTSSSSSSSPTTPSSSPPGTHLAGPVSAATSWAHDQLPASARILADLTTAKALHAAGLSHATTIASSADDYAIGTAHFLGAPVVSGLLDKHAVIAVFGTGSSAVMVWQRTTVDSAALVARWVADGQARITAENELLSNKALKTSPAAEKILSAGGLDLRAATVLALLAGQGTVSLLDIQSIPAEQAAGLPARTIDFETTAAVVAAVAPGLPAKYRPLPVQSPTIGIQRWTWPIRPEPLG